MSIAEENNNPCNIRYSASNKWVGQCGQDKNLNKDFCLFENCRYGFRAFFILCYNYYKIYNIRTIKDFVNKFAPATENNCNAYVDYLCKNMRTQNLEKLEVYNFYLLFAQFVSRFESGHSFCIEDVYNGYIMFALDYLIKKSRL